MNVVLRNRTRAHPPRQFRYNLSPAINVVNQSSVSDTCTDEVGYPVPHVLDLVQNTWDLSVTNYWISATNRVWGQVGYANTAINSDSWASPFFAAMTATSIAARGGPLRPRVFSITNLLEIRDIPRMLKHAGDLLHKLVTNPVSLIRPHEVASATLAYQFGWKPLVDDIRKMTEWAESVGKTQRDLQALSSGRGLRRTVNYGTHHRTLNGTMGPQSVPAPFVLVSKITQKDDTREWASIHWQLRNPNALVVSPTWANAFKISYGLHPLQIPVQIWKALPWSWAIDWFANVSEVLEAGQNLILFKPSRMCRMQTLTSTLKWDAKPSPFPHFGGQAYDGFPGGTITRTRKRRENVSVSSIGSLSIGIPFLDSYKLSVLGSLAIIRLTRGG